jgi:PAS domain S-box-containing protein
VELSEYVLDRIREDEEFVLYRGHHPREPGSPPILLLAPASNRPSRETLRKIEHEYSLRDELGSAGVVRPVALSELRGQKTLVLEDPGGETLDRCLPGPLEIPKFLRLAAGIATALSGLHRRELIHKDIRPANILFNPANDEIRLMGFGIASRLPRERQIPQPPELIAGTLAYMAPEQTGRMNRSIDSRSDLYALGVTLYEMLTGTLPFTASDSMQLVHCHIARQPTPPRERVKSVPPPISAIVVKLLAKTPEDRYQTASGVKADLQRCLTEWETKGRIADFALGQNDKPDRLLIPEKLYGRDGEIKILLTAFERVVTSGRPELVLVSGYSGIGKSSLVNELHKPLVPPRGLFASGKFDQYKRDIPYATVAQAFRGLIQSLLGKNEAELTSWRDGLREALGPNGQLIADLVPELKLILGEQPPAPDLPLQEAQRRFQLVFRRFISVFARAEHPLALFLDDLQWLDAATLDLIEDLLSQADVRHLLLIGAYRDNDVKLAHPLIRKLQAIGQAGATVHNVVLAPLAKEDLDQLIADALSCDVNLVEPLARLIHDKTGGNPFFAIQFIGSLVAEGLLAFNHDEGRWSWDLNRVRAKNYTDNVVELMIGKLNRLPSETLNILQMLACLGDQAEFITLEIVCQLSEERVHGSLWEAVETGLVLRSENSYRFLHDRVQEAAYSLIPEELRAEAHLRIGRLFMSGIPPETREERIFEIVNQLNRGAALIVSPAEKQQLAELNLIAGQRAKASSAYASALSYFMVGESLLAENSWEERHDVAFSLELNRAQCELLTGEIAAAEGRLTALSLRAESTVERAAVTSVRVDVYTALDQHDRGVAVCLDYLQRAGVEWSAHPRQQDAEREFQRIWSTLGNRTIEGLIDLPRMDDRTSLATLDVLIKLLAPALFTDANLLSLAICSAVNLSVQQGNSDASCVAYGWLGQIAGPHFDDYKAGFQFGLLGYELVEKRGLTRFRARTFLVFGAHVIPWAKHARAGRELIHRAFEAANKMGDLSFAGYSCVTANTNLLVVGDPLAEVQRETERRFEFAQRNRLNFVSDVIAVQLALVRTLRGSTREFGCFDDGQFDESRFERHLADNRSLAQAECFYWTRKTQARFLAGDYASAVEASLRAQELLWTAPSNLEIADFHLFAALSRARHCDAGLSPEQKERHFEGLKAHSAQLEIWARNCPENFENRAALIGAEIARIENRTLDAEQLYEKAIHSAHANGFPHNAALAYECASGFYRARGFDQFADTYLRNARSYYLNWGAEGKVRQLDQLHPHLRANAPIPGQASTIGAAVEHLDLATVMKVSQAVSSEIVLERLIETLLRTSIEHAGADRGLLILPQGGDLRIRAEALVHGESVKIYLRDAPISSTELSERVLHYAERTQESVLLEDASARGDFSSDEYIRERRSRSILCSPLVKQGKLIAILYLENSLAPNVFTAQRIAVLKVLTSAAAISLENSRLYHELQEREAKIRRLIDANVVGILVWDAEGRVLEANDAFLRMVGYDRDDLAAGRLRWTDMASPEGGAHETQLRMQELKKAGSLQPFEWEYFRKDGSRVPVLIGVATFDETANQGVAFVLDLSERKRAEEERDRLRQLEADLAHINRVSMMGEMAASLAHEINQPIGAAVANAQACLRFLDRQQPDVPEAHEAAVEMARDASRAADIIKRVRSLYQKSPPHEENVDVNEVIREMVVILRSEANRRSVTVYTELDDTLPMVLADRVQLQQVLMNLMLNGIEAMHDTTGALGIRSELDESGQLRISVSDTGVGLPAGKTAEIFEAFFTTKPQGSGLGLAITRSIVESHGGRLWVSPNGGRGTTFHFTLPRKMAARA